MGTQNTEARSDTGTSSNKNAAGQSRESQEGSRWKGTGSDGETQVDGWRAEQGNCQGDRVLMRCPKVIT